MNQIQKPEDQNSLSVVEKLARIDDRPPLIYDKPDVSLSVIFEGLVKTYAYLGHRNIFKGDTNQRKAAKLQIQEISAQILQGFKNNKKYRRITDVDFKAIIEKGCASGLSEIKNVSPKAIFDWSDQFLQMYLEKIHRTRQEYQKLQDNTSPSKNETIRKQNIEGIKALISYCQEPRTSPYTDVKQFQGYWLAKICERYATELPEHFIKTFSKRKDLYTEAKVQAQKAIGSKATDPEIKKKAHTIYCYKIVDQFNEAIQESGYEMYEEVVITAINEHHDKNQ